MARLSGRRVAVYARFSDDKQSPSSIDDQVTKCRRFIEDAGGTFSRGLVFEDRAISGASLQRPGIEALLRAVERREIDVVVTEDVSRISRDLADAAAVFKRLQYADVALLGVADGVDTSARGAKLLYGVRAMLSDVYLQDLSDKTHRGLEGRARRGLATGLLPFGYRSVPTSDGARVEIDPDEAAIVVRIFGHYRDGWSLARIATQLNHAGIVPPRGNGRRRREGWVATGVRAILKNAKYTGVWRWNVLEFRKVPGTNRRLPRRRASEDVIELARPELRIVSDDLWQAATSRFEAQQKPAQASGGRPPRYLLSGLLRCAVCGAPMNIQGGTPEHRYYRCYDAIKRGTCTNRLSVAEPIAREKILAAIRETIATPAAIEYVRKRLAEALGGWSRERDAKLREHRARLARTEDRIRGLVTFIADGDRSEYVVSTLRDLEAQARADKEAIRALEDEARAPVRLPSREDVERLAFDLDAALGADVEAGREALRQLLKGGEIRLEPTADGVYVARATVLPLRVLLNANAARGGDPERRDVSYPTGFAGAGFEPTTFGL